MADVDREIERVHVADPATEAPAEAARLTPRSPAADVVRAYLAEQLAVLRAQEPQVRRDDPDAVHRMRVAARRLRTTLTTFAPLFEAAAVLPLRDGLGVLARRLGAARDAEVLRARVRADLEGPGAAAAVGRVPHDLAAAADADLVRAVQEASDAVRSWLDGEDQHRLLRDLAVFTFDPPVTRAGRRRARAVLPGRVARRDVTLRRRLRRARRLPAGRRRDEALHRARTAAKAARYAAESVAGVLGKPAARYALATERLQEALGEHHDSVVARERLAELARRAPSTEVAFLLGRLHALEEARGREADRAARTAATAVRRPRLRRWLS